MKPLPTASMPYKEFEYWMDGSLPQHADESGSYWYYIRNPATGEQNRSQETFPSVIAASKAARAAIDEVSEMSEEVYAQMVSAALAARNAARPAPVESPAQPPSSQTAARKWRRR